MAEPAAASTRVGNAGALGALSDRELEVLRLVAQGLSNSEIADRIHLSAHTVKRHVANILGKLDLPTRAAATALAVRSGLT
jgi:DNA-binding CsgD family transcriptional regulator